MVESRKKGKDPLGGADTLIVACFKPTYFGDVGLTTLSEFILNSD